LIAHEDRVVRVLEAYKAAVFAKDVDAFVALYSPDARIFDMWGNWSYDRAGWQRAASEWLGSLGTEKVVVETRDVRTVIGDDVALASAFITYRGVSADGGELRAMDNRLTWALKREGVEWKIVHEHTSAPVDFATMKAMLRR
jgi:uncharacterized protein (TIGR02246 family)